MRSLFGATFSTLAAALVASLLHTVAAQGYPVKPIRLVVPASTGSAVDVPARVIAHELGAVIGRAVVVDNVPGASGNIASAQVARATPDGYTLLLQFSAFIFNPSLYRNVAYDPIKDFDAVMLAGWGTGLMLVVNPAMKELRDVKDLIALSKSKPGQLNYASPGIGSPNHLAMEIFKRQSGADLTHVPYKTPASMINAIASGDVATIFSSSAVAIPQVKGGKYKVLAITGRQRSPHVPEAPTMAEAGFPDLRVDVWLGFVVPAGTPRNIIQKLNADLKTVLTSATTVEALSRAGQEAATSTPEEFAQLIRNDLAYWSKMIKDLGITIE